MVYSIQTLFHLHQFTLYIYKKKQKTYFSFMAWQTYYAMRWKQMDENIFTNMIIFSKNRLFSLRTYCKLCWQFKDNMKMLY